MGILKIGWITEDHVSQHVIASEQPRALLLCFILLLQVVEKNGRWRIC